MAMTETIRPEIVNAVNDLYYELALSQDRDPFNGVDIARRNAPRLDTDGQVDTVTPPIHFKDRYDSTTVSPWKVSVTSDEDNGITAIFANGRIEPPTTSSPEQCQRWQYIVSLSPDAASYTVIKKALNGQEYVFNTKKPEIVARASEILVSRVTEAIAMW